MFVTTGFLSSDVSSSRSSLGRFLREAFPNIRPIQGEYKASGGALRVESTGRSASDVGAGIDLAFRIVLKPDHLPAQAHGLFPFNESFRHAVVALRDIVATEGAGTEQRARAIWALGYLVNAFRTGATYASDLVDAVRSGSFSANWMMERADPSALEEIHLLWMLGSTNLAAKVHGPYVFAPTFDLSTPGVNQRIAAEADFIANGTLIEVKTTVGTKSSGGSYYDALKADTLYQLLGYVLLDHSDTYEINSLGLYSARYGHLHQWPLGELLAITADGPFDLTAARQRVWDLMHGDIEYIER